MSNTKKLIEKLEKAITYEEFADATRIMLSNVHTSEELRDATCAVFAAKNRLMDRSENFQLKIQDGLNAFKKEFIYRRTDLSPIYGDVSRKYLELTGTRAPEWIEQLSKIEDEES